MSARRRVRVCAAHLMGWTLAVVLLSLLPTFAATVQSPAWSRTWHRLVDRLMKRPVLIVSGGVLFGLTAAFGLGGLLLVLQVPAAAVFLACGGRLAYPHTPRRFRTRTENEGWAGYWEWREHASAHAVRLVALETRPSLQPLVVDPTTKKPSQILIEALPVTECGTWLGKTAIGPNIGVHCYIPHRDTFGLIAPPQTGKTSLLAGIVIDHIGPVVSTSTKADVFAMCAALRALLSRSGRVELWDPEGLAAGILASTFRWSPVTGCEAPAIAAERAGALVGATTAAGGDDGQFWLDSAAKVLRCFLLAAALDGRTMEDVFRWVTNPDAVEGGADEARKLLSSPEHLAQVPTGWAGELRQVLGTAAKRTKESIFLTLSQSVAFMADPNVAALCLPSDDEPVFDVESFLDDFGTLFIIGSDREHAPVAPLLAALTTHLFEECKRIAGPGRLDPPPLFALDEAPLITPVPLDRWLADAGGRGIHIGWACQSPSQLAQRWGERGANTIWNATNAKLIYGGLTLDADLESISRLCGEVRREVPAENGMRLEWRRLVPVDLLRTLPRWHALLILRSMAPTVVRIRPAWKRKDVRNAGPVPRIQPISEVFARNPDVARLPALPPPPPKVFAVDPAGEVEAHLLDREDREVEVAT